MFNSSSDDRLDIKVPSPRHQEYSRIKQNMRNIITDSRSDVYDYDITSVDQKSAAH
jgi:hypothetical protein